MFIKVPNYLAPNFTTEDFMIQVRGHLVKYFYGCHMTPVTRGALGYVPYQKGIIQGHLVHMYATRKASSLCSRVVFRAVLSLDVSTQTLFLCYMSVKYTLRGYFCFLCPCYALVVMSTEEINAIFEPFIGYIYIYIYIHTYTYIYVWGHRWILALLLIFIYLWIDTNIQPPILWVPSVL